MLLIVSISTKQQLEMVTSSYNDGEETHYDALVMGKAKHPTSGEIEGR